MKNITLFVAIICSAMCFTMQAQFEVNEQGKISIGQTPQYNNTGTEYLDTVTTVKIHGTGYFASGARIAFGDSKSVRAMNVMVGELNDGDGDTDKLWLHGKKGLYYTSNHIAGDTILFYDTDKGNYFKFNTSVIATSYSQPSDTRFKTNITPLSDALESLESLQSVTYNLKAPASNSYTGATSGNGKEQQDEEYFNQYYQERNQKAAQKMHYGFLAQDLQQIFPDLVDTDKDGYLYVDYIGLIPVLVEAVKELKAELSELKGEKKSEETLKAPQHSGIQNMEFGSVSPKLYQNSPNPFNAETVIRYALPESVQNANLYVYDLQGKQLMNIAIEQRGEAQVTIHGSNLQAGMYIYALIADGQEIDSKRMILTK